MKINLNLVGVGLNELRIIEQKSTKNNKNIKSDKKIRRHKPPERRLSLIKTIDSDSTLFRINGVF